MNIIQLSLSQKAKKVKEYFIENGLSPLVSHILAQRGMETLEQVNYDYKIKSVFSLKGIEEIVKALYQARLDNAKITIVADYDCDGATSCAIALQGLQKLGFNVDYVVPNRFKHGYGLSQLVIDMLIETKGKPDYIFTVDNGIACQTGVDYANSLGIKVLVTDHHLPAKDKVTGDIAENPKALALVNPNQKGDTSGLNNMAGCGVAFYVLEATRLYFIKQGLVDKSVNFNFLLDLVALGTVADVVKLDENNRILVHLGLQRMRAGYASNGIKALFNISNRDIEDANSEDLGFNIGPRINAAGRLEDMTYGIQCLISKNETYAINLAEKLNEYNVKRKEKEKEMKEIANQILFIEEQTDNFTKVVYDPSYHEGVVGIVASRIKEETGCPTIVFTNVEDSDTLIKGSGRSMDCINLKDALDEVYKMDPSIFVAFGGHSKAAGLTINKSKLDDFKRCFEEYVRSQVSADDLEKTIHYDLELKPEDITIENAKTLRNVIWGQGFVSPLFKITGKIVACDTFGKRIVENDVVTYNKEHLKMVLDVGGKQVNCIKFFDTAVLPIGHTISLFGRFNVRFNSYTQKDELSILVQDYDPDTLPEKRTIEDLNIVSNNYSDIIKLKSIHNTTNSANTIN